MKQRRLKLAAGVSAAFLALSAPLPALAQEDSVVISIEGWGDWVLVTHEVCVSAFGHTVCHQYQKWEWRPEQQREVHRCDGLCP
ncbi:MAG: hypothetical protein ACT6TH_02650 [Brevundimonas sp.]|jgi:hypothetical protein|uniref:hypothetical protein n=1 Tax=Brevundimonas sp. TaxID=1871086 RepID=UPI0040347F3E